MSPTKLVPRRAIVSVGSLALAMIVGTMAAPCAAADNWPQFRGPGGNGVAVDDRAPETWSREENVVWKVAIPGRGWSSPIVWGDRIFATTAAKESGKFEPVRKGLYLFGERPAPTEALRWMVYCLDWDTGKVLWEAEAHRGIPEHAAHLKNTFASETPVTDGERVYAYFGNVGLFCYDMEGHPLWQRKWDRVAMRMGWGTAASPVLYKDRLYIVNDNEDASFLTALDTKTGKTVWTVERDEKSNWSTPFIWENEKRTEIVTAGAKKVRSYSLDGELLWELGGMSSITIPTPFAHGGLLYVTSGYVLDTRKPMFAIRPGASGDISLSAEEASNEFIAWRRKMDGPYNPSPVIYGDLMYVLYDRGFLACFDARTGEEVYGKRRLGGTFTASPWAADGKIFCLNEDGDASVIAAGSEFERLRINRVGELCMSTPAVVRGNLILRTETTLYRFGEDQAH